jgi:hypothetical protein
MSRIARRPVHNNFASFTEKKGEWQMKTVTSGRAGVPSTTNEQTAPGG